MIEVLSIFPVFSRCVSWGWTWWCLLPLCMITIFIFEFKRDKDYSWIVLIVIFTGLLFLCLSTGKEIKEFSHMEMQIKIHGKINFQEFIEKYEIVEVYGDIVTVKEIIEEGEIL